MLVHRPPGIAFENRSEGFVEVIAGSRIRDGIVELWIDTVVRSSLSGIRQEFESVRDQRESFTFDPFRFIRMVTKDHLLVGVTDLFLRGFVTEFREAQYSVMVLIFPIAQIQFT